MASTTGSVLANASVWCKHLKPTNDSRLNQKIFSRTLENGKTNQSGKSIQAGTTAVTTTAPKSKVVMFSATIAN
jgi:hypothetical protein